MAQTIKTLNSSQLLSEIGITGWSDSDFAIAHKRYPSSFAMSDPFRITDYAVGYVTQGYFKILVNLQEVTLQKNSLFIFKPFDIIEGIDRSEELAASGFSFTKEFIVGQNTTDISSLDDLTCLKQNEVPIVAIEERYVEKLDNYFVTINDLVEYTDNPHRRKMIRNLFELLLYTIDALYQQNKIIRPIRKLSRKNEIANQFRKLLVENFKEERNIGFYADRLFVTTKYLSEVLKSVTGKTAGEIIDEIVILEAKILLKNSTNTMSEIADILHFSDQFFFSNFFKKHTGLSPSHYRKLQ